MSICRRKLCIFTIIFLEIYHCNVDIAQVWPISRTRSHTISGDKLVPKTHFGVWVSSFVSHEGMNLNRWRSTHTMICSLGNAMVLGICDEKHPHYTAIGETRRPNLCVALPFIRVLYFIEDRFRQVRNAYVCKYTS